MKTLLLTSLLLITTHLQAASTGTLFISGTVAAINELVITPNNDAVNLNITNGEVNKQVAIATETSNNLAGYKIYAKSLNSSKLVHNVDSNYHTTYTMSYDGGSPVTLSSSDQVVKNVSSLAGLTTDNSDIKVNVAAAPTLPSGVYSDVITISIVAN